MRRKNRNLIFALLIIAFVTVLAVALLLSDRSNEPNPTAEEYFDISDILYTGQKENSHLRVSTFVIFNISAVEGDATEIVLTNIPGMTPDVYVGTINQNASKVVTIQLNNDLVLRKEEDLGFPFSFRISCHELYDKITIYLQWPPPQTAS
jgi:hypothetical protein